jgi:hypothetical protein
MVPPSRFGLLARRSGERDGYSLAAPGAAL